MGRTRSSKSGGSSRTRGGSPSKARGKASASSSRRVSRGDGKAAAKQRKAAVQTKARREARPADGKPAAKAAGGARNQAGLTARELEHFRELLLAKRRELLGDVVSMEQEALRTAGETNLSNLPLHMADMGTDNYEQEFTLSLVENDRKLLHEINVALTKIRDGTYGICEGTGKPISKARLEAQPWARYSIEYARELERRRMGR